MLNVKNNAESTLAEGISDKDLELTIATGDGSKFPSSNFHITIDNEIVLCTGRTGDVFTIERGKEDTTPAHHLAGSTIELRITAEIINQIKEEIDKKVSGSYDADYRCYLLS